MACSKLLFLVLAMLHPVAIGAECYSDINLCIADLPTAVPTNPADGYIPPTMTESEWTNTCNAFNTSVKCLQDIGTCPEKDPYITYFSSLLKATCEDITYNEYKMYRDCIHENVPAADLMKCREGISPTEFICNKYQDFVVCVVDRVNCTCGADAAQWQEETGAAFLPFVAAKIGGGSECELDMSVGDLDCSTFNGKAPVIATMWLISCVLALVALVA